MQDASREWWRGLIQALVAVLVAGAAVVAPGPASADDALTELDRDPVNYVGSPAMVTTWGGVTLVAWSHEGTKDRIYLRRAVGATSALKPVGVPIGKLTNIRSLSLLDDPKAKRTLLLAEADAGDLANTLGVYVWRSTNQGASWSAPKKVWDSFSTTQAALDGNGGFYLWVNQTGTQYLHVPAGLELQSFYDNTWVDLSGRLGSRGWLDLTSAGAGHTPLFAFQQPGGLVYVHRGRKTGNAAETRVYSQASGQTPIAGDNRGAAVGAVRAWAGNGDKYRLYVRGINPVTGALSAIKQVSAANEQVSPAYFDLEHLMLPNSGSTGRYLAHWLNYKTGALRYAKSMTTNPAGTWSTPITVKKGTHGKYHNFYSPVGNQYWMFANGYQQRKARNVNVLVATRIGVDK